MLTSAGDRDIFVAKLANRTVCGDGIVEGGEQCDDGNTVSSDGCSATCQIELADLVITKSATPNPVKVNKPLTSTLTITNNGPATATGVTVTDTLPYLATLVSASASQGSCSGTGPVLCNLGDMANGAIATVTLVVTSKKKGKESLITNTASVTGNEVDPNMSNNTATVTTTVAANPKIKEIISFLITRSPKEKLALFMSLWPVL